MNELTRNEIYTGLWSQAKKIHSMPFYSNNWKSDNMYIYSKIPVVLYLRTYP